MTGKVIPFPDPRGEGMTPDQWQEGLAQLHERLYAELMKERKNTDHIRVALTIDDIMDIGLLIEEKLGPDWFSNEC